MEHAWIKAQRRIQNKESHKESLSFIGILYYGFAFVCPILGNILKRFIKLFSCGHGNRLIVFQIIEVYSCSQEESLGLDPPGLQKHKNGNLGKDLYCILRIYIVHLRK